MPCDSITTQSVNLQNAMPTIIEAALKALGYDITGSSETQIVARRQNFILDWTKGKGITVRGMRTNEVAITDLTREYSKQAVSWAASRAGWQVTSTGSNTLAVTRR